MRRVSKYKKDPNRPTCRLIALCTDSQTVDLNAFGVILAQGATLTSPLLKDQTAAQDQSHVNAVLSALQAYNSTSVSSSGGGAGCLGGSTGAGSSAANTALSKTNMSSSKPGGKNGKGKNAGNSIMQSSQTAAAKAAQNKRASASASTMAGLAMTIDDESRVNRVPLVRSEWYDVVQGPQWEVPIVFIRHLPELERGDDDANAATFSSSSRGMIDTNAQVTRALQIIAEELEMESIGPEIVVVLAVRDARAMASLIGRPSSFDTRLIVQFMDSPCPSGTGESTGRTSSHGRIGGSSKRIPAAGLLDSTNPTAAAAAATAAAQAASANSFGAWIDRQQRERALAMVDGPTRAAHASGPICLRASIDEVGDDRTGVVTAWVDCCLKTVLPTMRQVVRGIAGYGEFVSSKPQIQYPVFPMTGTRVAAIKTTVAPEDSLAADLVSPGGDSTVGAALMPTHSSSISPTRRQKAMNSGHSVNSLGTASTAATASPMSTTFQTAASIAQGTLGKRGETMQSALFPPANISRDEVGWSEYVRKRKVRGHFTCISAARALVAQVAVTMAQRQRDTIAKPTETAEKQTMKQEKSEEEENAKMKVYTERENDRESEVEIFNETMKGHVESDNSPLVASKPNPTDSRLCGAATGSSVIRRTLRDYVSQRTSLMPGISNRPDAVVAAVDTFENTGLKSVTSFAFSLNSTQTATFAAAASVEEGSWSVSPTLNKSTIHPKDHVLDRLKAPPLPEDIRWITQQLVKKGLGACAPSQTEMDADVDNFAANSTSDFSVSYEGERLRKMMLMRQLLEEPLNGLSVEADEDAIDQQVLALVEEAFAREAMEETKIVKAASTTAQSTTVLSQAMASGTTRIKEAPLISISHSELLGEVAHAGVMPLEDHLQRSVENGLTTRARQHILQQILIERAVAAMRMSGTIDRDAGSTIATILATDSRPVEEYVAKPVAVRRMYEFQSRFGAHMCRLLRRVIPDEMEALKLATSYTSHAEHINTPKRVMAIMSAGVPTPPERRVRRLWCHLVSGIPSLDQFGELAAAETMCGAGEVDARTDSNGGSSSRVAGFAIPGEESIANETPRRVNPALDDFIRRQLLQRLRDSSQFLLPATRPEDGTARPSVTQTVLEGRHALYPYCNAVVEIGTTDRGRTCRYVNASELSCVLHYSISPPPPPPQPLFSSAKSQAQSAATVSASPSPASAHTGTGNGAEVTSLLATNPAPSSRDETIYLTTSFDDGVTLTCTRRLSDGPCPSMEEKAAAAAAATVNATSLAVRNTNSRGGSRSRRGGPAFSRNGAGSGGDEDNSALARRGPSRRKGRGRGGDDDSAGAVMPAMPRADTARWPFPVAADGSVLLWPGTAQKRSTAGLNQPNTLRGLVGYDITLSAGGITVHAEERSGIIWFSRHEARTYPAPESLCCAHAVDGPNTLLRTSTEVEVRRAVVQSSGTVFRFFQSGSIQTLYANGAVLTRFQCTRVASMPSFWSLSSAVSSVCETLVTVDGQCFVREVSASAEESEPPRFLRLATPVRTSDVYDCTHHCQILSRTDGVTIVRYLCRNVDLSTHTNNAQSPNPIDPSLGTCEVARVVLHADGTSITALASGDVWHLEKKQKSHTRHRSEHGNTRAHGNEMDPVPPPLQLLVSQAATVAAACGGDVRYCVEAPSLPRLFLCAEGSKTSTEAPTENTTAFNTQLSSSPTDKKLTGVSVADKSFLTTKHSWSDLSLSCAIAPCLAVPAPSLDMSDPQVILPLAPPHSTCSFALPINVAENSPRPACVDRFYMAFADGSALRRRIVLRGSRSTPFLETLLTRTTETSIRVIHDSGLVVVEPADAVRHNASALSSLAIGEGFPMFDLALGGLRLVDHQHHVTEVKDLYSPGAVRAGVVPSSLESLLRELVAPSYRPHRVPRARQLALRAEEAESEAQYHRDRSMGIYPPLLRRLREFAEGFIIAYRLLSMDALLAATRAFEGSPAMRVGGPVTLKAAAAACWGAADPNRLVSHCEEKHSTRNNGLPSVVYTGKSKGTQDSVRNTGGQASRTMPLDPIPPLGQSDAPILPPGGVAPLFFSEFEDGLAVQYLHDRDVSDCFCAMDGDSLPVFLTHSVIAGEPGVQQLTLFRLVGTAGATASVSTRGLSGTLSALSPTSTKTVKDAGLRATACAVANGSILSESAWRQERLGAFAGTRAAFRTCAWLPPTLQPPRRHLNPRVCRSATASPSGASHVICGGQSFISLEEASEANSSLPTTYERMRVFLRFSDVTWVAKQAVLWGEAHRIQQLMSFVTYHKTALQSLQWAEHETEEQRHILGN